MDIEKTISDYIVENFLFGEDSELSPSQSLLETGILDSTGVLELVMLIEETYGIEVADEDMLPENLDSIDNIGRYVRRKIGEHTSNAPDASGGDGG